jgi:hypothetical protein
MLTCQEAHSDTNICAHMHTNCAYENVYMCILTYAHAGLAEELDSTPDRQSDINPSSLHYTSRHQIGQDEEEEDEDEDEDGNGAEWTLRKCSASGKWQILGLICLLLFWLTAVCGLCVPRR